jgi:phosphate starvation-inducible PhoH-like protein
MAKKKKVRNEELEAFHKETYESFRDIPVNHSFELRYKNAEQRLAFSVYEQHDIIFLLGPAGTGKSHLACMFALHDLIEGNKERIVLTRPIVEAGESLGYLPGTFSEKTDPYMLPLYDCIQKMVPKGNMAEQIQSCTEVAPLAYMRGRTFDDSVCILDESQNCTWGQLVLFLTRLGEHSKMIITGDPNQTDIGRDSALMDVVHRLEGVDGIGMVRFSEDCIVRHKLVSEIIKRLQKNA